jgi:hypothetical protein
LFAFCRIRLCARGACQQTFLFLKLRVAHSSKKKIKILFKKKFDLKLANWNLAPSIFCFEMMPELLTVKREMDRSLTSAKITKRKKKKKKKKKSRE